MQGLILAGGEGSRLAKAGVSTPKALIPVGGTPQIVRLLRTFARLGCESVTCLLREGVPTTLLEAAAAQGRIPYHVQFCRTPSSLHTLVEGLQVLPPGPVFCSMVDTVMPWGDWQRAYATATGALAAGADAVLVVTSYVDDERPLHVQRDGGGRVVRIGDQPAAPPCVTGGVYAFGPSARAVAEEALALGLERMRAFLGLLVQRGAAVGTVEVPRIIDLDDLRDLAAANAWQDSCEMEDSAEP
ncbi:MAG TPA: NTP transferase domain-containing protein [Gemmatimonadales bacterium]|nr:NTP transferase domain-containing protein [Gemmatimonadales bacterium]